MMDTPNGNDELGIDIEIRPCATDRHIRPELSAATGRDIVISGKKSDGTEFKGRVLENVSFEVTSKGIVVRGFSPESRGVRSFNLNQLTDLKVAA
jgi:hypothetical protein